MYKKVSTAFVISSLAALLAYQECPAQGAVSARALYETHYASANPAGYACCAHDMAEGTGCSKANSPVGHVALGGNTKP